MKTTDDNFSPTRTMSKNQRGTKKATSYQWRKVYPLKMLRASLLLAVTALLLLFGSEGRAIAQITTNYFTWTWTSAADGLTLGGAAGAASVGGEDSFLDTINGNYNSAAGRNAGNLTVHPPVPTAPPAQGTVYTTDSPLNCSLTLNGGVQFPDATYNQATANSDSITLTLTGWINVAGNSLTVGPITITAAEYASGLNTGIQAGFMGYTAGGFLGKDGNGFLDFSITQTGPLPCAVDGNNNTFEQLTISSVGRVLYQNDDTFIGVVPEPSTLALLGLAAYSGYWVCSGRRKA